MVPLKAFSDQGWKRYQLFNILKTISFQVQGKVTCVILLQENILEILELEEKLLNLEKRQYLPH